MGLISEETAQEIAFAYREISAATKLLEKVKEQNGQGTQPDFRDSFGRQRGLQLGIPSGNSSHTIYDMPWSLAMPVIEAQIAAKKSVLAILSEKARAELGDAP